MCELKPLSMLWNRQYTRTMHWTQCFIASVIRAFGMYSMKFTMKYSIMKYKQLRIIAVVKKKMVMRLNFTIAWAHSTNAVRHVFGRGIWISVWMLQSFGNMSSVYMSTEKPAYDIFDSEVFFPFAQFIACRILCWLFLKHQLIRAVELICAVNNERVKVNRGLIWIKRKIGSEKYKVCTANRGSKTYS